MTQFRKPARVLISICSILAAVGFLMLVTSGPTHAVTTGSSQPAAKATAKVSNITLIDSTTQQGWTPILYNTIKTANQKDLFIDVSLEAGLYTTTLVRSKAGTRDTSTAEATIAVRVMIDEEPAEPGEVIFARRSQQLSAVFQGLLEGCLSVDSETGQVIIDEECLQPEELELILDTMNANSFNFVVSNLTSGVHTIRVEAMIESDTSAGAGEAAATATIGKGSVTVEEVRMIQGEDILLD